MWRSCSERVAGNDGASISWGGGAALGTAAPPASPPPAMPPPSPPSGTRTLLPQPLPSVFSLDDRPDFSPEPEPLHPVSPSNTPPSLVSPSLFPSSLLPVIAVSISLSAAEICRSDARTIIPFDVFRFTHRGILELNVSSICLSDTSPNARAEEVLVTICEGRARMLQDQSITPSPSLSPPSTTKRPPRPSTRRHLITTLRRRRSRDHYLAVWRMHNVFLGVLGSGREKL